MNRLVQGSLAGIALLLCAAEVQAQYNPYMQGTINPYRPMTVDPVAPMQTLWPYRPGWRRPYPYPYPYPYPFFFPYPVDGNTNPPAAAQQPASDTPPTDNRARIAIRLPSYAADVWVDNEKMADKIATERLFVSPTLEPGHTYTYTIKVRFPRRGENVTEQRVVQVRANQVTSVDFTASTAKLSTP